MSNKLEFSQRDGKVLLEAVAFAIGSIESLIQNTTRSNGTIPAQYKWVNAQNRKYLKRWDAVETKLRERLRRAP